MIDPIAAGEPFLCFGGVALLLFAAFLLWLHQPKSGGTE